MKAHDSFLESVLMGTFAAIVVCFLGWVLYQRLTGLETALDACCGILKDLK